MLINLKEYAIKNNLAYSTVRSAIRRGKLFPDLKKGRCWYIEESTPWPNNAKKHGLSHTRLFNIWQCMLQRCNNPKNPRYNCYGGKGVSVCNQWKNDFTIFYEWATQNGYADNLTIDRINTEGNYEPDNCRWVTWAENLKHRNLDMQNRVAQHDAWIEKWFLNGEKSFRITNKKRGDKY